MKTIVGFPVWGNEYIEIFQRYIFPQQLTPGNLLSLGRGSSIYIYTKKEEISKFNIIDFKKTLSKININLLFIEIDNIILRFNEKINNKYSLVTKIQNHLLSQSQEYEAIIFGYADAYFSNNSYLNSLRYLNEGYDLVLCPGLNVNKNEFIKYLTDNNISQIFDNTILANIALNNLHALTYSRFIDHEYMNNYPSQLLFGKKNECISILSFHKHPVIIKVQKDNRFFKNINNSLDDDFVDRLIDMSLKVKNISNSNDMIIIGLHPPLLDNEILYAQPKRKPNIHDVWEFTQNHITENHRNLFRFPYLISSVKNYNSNIIDFTQQESISINKELDSIQSSYELINTENQIMMNKFIKIKNIKKENKINDMKLNIFQNDNSINLERSINNNLYEYNSMYSDFYKANYFDLIYRTKPNFISSYLLKNYLNNKLKLFFYLNFLIVLLLSFCVEKISSLFSKLNITNFFKKNKLSKLKKLKLNCIITFVIYLKFYDNNLFLSYIYRWLLSKK
jgi:hypothetical protein